MARSVAAPEQVPGIASRLAGALGATPSGGPSSTARNRPAAPMVIEAHGLRKRFGAGVAVDGVPLCR
jgi:hypothetical protein